MAQSVECPTVTFNSGHDPRVRRSSSVSGSVLSVEPACDSLSPPAPPPHLCLRACALEEEEEEEEGEEDFRVPYITKFKMSIMLMATLTMKLSLT